MTTSAPEGSKEYHQTKQRWGLINALDLDSVPPPTMRGGNKRPQYAAEATAANNRQHHTGRICVDSGCSTTVIADIKLLEKLKHDIQTQMKVATGELSTTTGHGKISIMTRNNHGEQQVFTDIGEGFTLKNLVFSLMSVSQMCKHGCSVIFKPKEAYILTPDGGHIPMEMDSGLYFIPRDDKESQTRQTVKDGLDASKAYTMTDPLAIAHEEGLSTIRHKHRANIEKASAIVMNHVKRMDYKIINFSSRTPIRVRELIGNIQTTRKLLNKCLVSVAKDQSVTAQMRSDMILSTQFNRQEVKKMNYEGKAAKAVQEILVAEQAERKAHRAYQATQPAEINRIMNYTRAGSDRARRLDQRKIPPKKSLEDLDYIKWKVSNGKSDAQAFRSLNKRLAETKERLEAAIQKQMTETTAAATNFHKRELELARYWHMVHTSLACAPESVTDAAVLSGEFCPEIKALQPKGFDSLTAEERLPPRHLKFCQTCQRARFTKKGPNLRSTEVTKRAKIARRARRPGEKWFVDITGPFTPSHEGHRYLVVFVDDQSRYMVTYPVEKKSDALDSLKDLRQVVKNAMGKCAEGHQMSEIKALQSDRGGEFTSNVNGTADDSIFNQYCEEAGIEQMFTSAQSSDMNGVAEGHIRIVNDAWRCQLVGDGSPMEEWSRASQSATYAINRRPRQAISK